MRANKLIPEINPKLEFLHHCIRNAKLINPGVLNFRDTIGILATQTRLGSPTVYVQYETFTTLCPSVECFF